MPYEWVGFRINPPIRETIGKTPDDIQLTKEKDVITEMRVLIGDQRTQKIKNSNHFKKKLAESEAKRIERNPTEAEDTNKKSKNFINQLEQEIKNCATQRANYFINQLNYRFDSAQYDIHFKELAIMMFQREISLGMGGYVKSEYVTDIFQLDDKDNLSNRLINNYSNGLRALKNKDLVSAYKYFYLAFPEGHKITGDSITDLDLKILRHGASHNILENQKIQDRAKELLGEDFVKPDDDPTKTYAYVDMTNSNHLDLFNKYTPVVRGKAKDFIAGVISREAT